jgi:hypothetical protein
VVEQTSLFLVPPFEVVAEKFLSLFTGFGKRGE